MIGKTKIEEGISETTQEEFGVPVTSLVETTASLAILVSVPRRMRMPFTQVKLSAYLDKILWIAQNLPSRHVKKMLGEVLPALKKVDQTGDYDSFEQILGDWEFTAEIESTPELKQGLEESAKRLATEKTVPLEEILGRIQRN
jgi:hypothetical protein